MPIDYKNYPDNWKEIRQGILDRANNKCEFCHVPNSALIIRTGDGLHQWIMATEGDYYDWLHGICNRKVIKVVLTIAHLDHNTQHNEPSNLKALCQRCHLRYDSQLHAKNSAATRQRKKAANGQLSLVME